MFLRTGAEAARTSGTAGPSLPLAAGAGLGPRPLLPAVGDEAGAHPASSPVAGGPLLGRASSFPMGAEGGPAEAVGRGETVGVAPPLP